MGVGNLSSPNNYSVISASSAGGTFEGRRLGTGEAAAYLADTQLLNSLGTPLAGPQQHDYRRLHREWLWLRLARSPPTPHLYFGFFDKDNLPSGTFGAYTQAVTTTGVSFKSIGGTTYQPAIRVTVTASSSWKSTARP